uniref:CHHC U11-48K-type domain-containing protein n=1 Tax=Heterorhabditis bacteriophora TaxID=37862 RepID=A0A1I7XE40_HETBA
MTCPRHVQAVSECASLIVCPYSESHHVSPAEFAMHMKQCRARYCTENAQRTATHQVQMIA